MNNKFVLEMDEIKPSEELLQNTINLIREKELNKNAKKFKANKIIISFATLLGLTSTCFAGYQILSKRFNNFDKLGVIMETESEEKFDEDFSYNYATLYNENNQISINKSNDQTLKEIVINRKESKSDFIETFIKDEYRTLDSGEYGYYIEANLVHSVYSKGEDTYLIEFISEQQDELVIIDMFINKNANNFKELYENDINMLNSFKIDKIMEDYYKNKYEEIICQDIKLKINNFWEYEKITENCYSISHPRSNGEENIMLEFYSENENLEDFYQDDIIIESIGSSDFNEKHEYAFYLESGERISISSKDIIETRKNKGKYIERLQPLNEFKVTSKSNIEKGGIRGIRYTYSYTIEDVTETKKIYLLSVNNKIYKLVLSHESEEMLNIINSTEKVTKINTDDNTDNLSKNVSTK